MNKLALNEYLVTTMLYNKNCLNNKEAPTLTEWTQPLESEDHGQRTCPTQRTKTIKCVTISVNTDCLIAQYCQCNGVNRSTSSLQVSCDHMSCDHVSCDHMRSCA